MPKIYTPVKPIEPSEKPLYLTVRQEGDEVRVVIVDEKGDSLADVLRFTPNGVYRVSINKTLAERAGVTIKEDTQKIAIVW